MKWRVKLSRRRWLSLLIIVFLGLAFYFLLSRPAKSSVTNQLLKQEQVVARAEAGNIMSFFQTFGDSIAVLSQLKSITSPSSAIWELDAFTEQWRESGFVSGIALTDVRGIVRFNSNVSGIHSAGVSLADRDYFLWAKGKPKAGEYFVGAPVTSRLGASRDRLIVPVASVVYQNGVFSGVVVAAVDLNNLSRNYLELMKVKESTEVYLINENGDLLYSGTNPETVGSNVFETVKKYPILDNQYLTNKLKSVLSGAEEGTVAATYLDPASGKIEEHLVAYSPIKLGSQNWVLVMSSPAENVAKVITPIYIRQISILVLVSLSILLFEYIIIKESRS